VTMSLLFLSLTAYHVSYVVLLFFIGSNTINTPSSLSPSQELTVLIRNWCLGLYNTKYNWRYDVTMSLLFSSCTVYHVLYVVLLFFIRINTINTPSSLSPSQELTVLIRNWCLGLYKTKYNWRYDVTTSFSSRSAYHVSYVVLLFFIGINTINTPSSLSPSQELTVLIGNWCLGLYKTKYNWRYDVTTSTSFSSLVSLLLFSAFGFIPRDTQTL
jgi:hypothetical protein